MDSQDVDELFAWATAHNLNHVVVFHNQLQALLFEKCRELEPGDPHVRHTIELYRNLNAANALLLVVAYLEELLLLLWTRHLPRAELAESSSIDRYKPLFRKLGVDVGSTRCWITITDAVLVRHCILHANGRVSFMRNADAFQSCVARYADALSVHSDRLVVTPQFLRTVVQAVWDFREELLRRQSATS